MNVYSTYQILKFPCRLIYIKQKILYRYLVLNLSEDSFDSKKYEKWSDERFHAFLVRAESIIYKTAVTVLSSGTDIFAIAAGCLNIRDSYKVLEKVKK